MQLHQLKPKNKTEKRKRVGRGGKRGTFSGHGSKGQKARAGTRIRPGFRGGDNPVWKLFPKQRGASKKVDIKKASFRLHETKPNVVNLDSINNHFQDGETVSARMLVKKGIVKGGKGIKILGEGTLDKKLKFPAFKFSKSAREKIAKAGGTIEEK
jgi:large subunit ribosomal protein L15